MLWQLQHGCHRCPNTPFLCKMLCKYNYKYGYCPNHMYIGYGMLVQYQSVIFSCLTLISIAFILYVT